MIDNGVPSGINGAEDPETCRLVLELIFRMTADGLAGEVPKLKEDADFRESIF